MSPPRPTRSLYNFSQVEPEIRLSGPIPPETVPKAKFLKIQLSQGTLAQTIDVYIEFAEAALPLTLSSRGSSLSKGRTVLALWPALFELTEGWPASNPFEIGLG